MATITSLQARAERPPGAIDLHRSFGCVALLLKGGGALGAYQGGVYEALAEAEIHPDWVAGISIGAINAAIIAGNAPEARAEKLRAFWESISVHFPWEWLGPRLHDDGHEALNQLSATASLMGGIPGFFAPRLVSPWLHPPGGAAATSYYNTAPLRTTLMRFVDFDRINARTMRFSVGAVNVRTGNFIYFDNTKDTIGPDHVLASSALPPGFAPVEIDGEHYWDGGLVSNTPLHWVLQCGPRQDTLAFQVDLWNARGEVPRTMPEVATRVKEILYSSRTRFNTERFKATEEARHAVAALLKDLPPEMQNHPAVKVLAPLSDRKVYSIVHLIYRARAYEGESKDYEFSHTSMEDHWRKGVRDTVHTLQHPEALARPTNPEGLNLFDIHQHEAAAGDGSAELWKETAHAAQG